MLEFRISHILITVVGIQNEANLLIKHNIFTTRRKTCHFISGSFFIVIYKIAVLILFYKNRRVSMVITEFSFL